MADTQLAGGLELNHVTAIDVHHPPEFRDDYGEKSVEIDGSGERHREAVDDPLARLVHFDLAF
jgi:hypothetical protein